MVTATSAATEQEIIRSAPTASRLPATVVGGVAVSLVVLGHLPLVITYFRRLLLFEHYQFVPLVLIGVPALMIARGRDVPREAWRGGIPYRALLIACGMLAVASLLCSPWAAMVSLILSLGMFLRFYAGPYWRELLPVWMLLLLILRPPLHLDLSLITKLQLETSKVSSVVLDNLGVKHLMDGNVLVIPQRRFLVEEACSGINSVFALLTAAAFYAVFVRASLVRAVLLILSAVFWACFMNLVRVAATIFAFEQLQIDLGAGIAHSITGMVTFALAVLFVAFTDQLVRFFLDPIDPEAVQFWKQRTNPFVQWWNRQRPPISEVHAPERQTPASLPAAVPVTILVAAVSLSAAGWQFMALRAESAPQRAPAVIAQLEADSLPQRLGDWSRADFEVEHRPKNSVLGDVSKIWSYSSPSAPAMISVDYPFRGWHALGSCYQGQGWELDEYRTVPLADTDEGRKGFISEVKMHRPSGERALLLFVLMDRNGEPLVDPTIGSFWLQIARRSIERLKRPFATSFPELATEVGVTTQLQMLVAPEQGEISDTVESEAREQFKKLQSQLSELLATQQHAATTAGVTP